MIKILVPLVALTVSNLALADTHFECGTVSCSAFGSSVITAIDDVVVGGEHFNVTFSNLMQGTTFLFSSHASSPGQPLTGVDAANALDAFYATQHGPIPQDDGPGILASVDGVVSNVFFLETAFKPSSTAGIFDIDITEPFLGLPFPGPVLTAPDVGDSLPGPGGGPVVTHAGRVCFGTCTVWTPVAAPEVSPVSASSGLTLLLGSLLVLRGRRQILTRGRSSD
jgi:hypothetical protein